jgi:hypothetical protein
MKGTAPGGGALFQGTKRTCHGFARHEGTDHDERSCRGAGGNRRCAAGAAARFHRRAHDTLLARLGYETVPRLPDGTLPALDDPRLRGAIISTAVLSTVKESHLEVYEQIRIARPALPLLFATLVPVAHYARGLASLLSRHRRPARVLSLADVLADPVPSSAEAVLLVDKAAVEAGGAMLDAALHRWFR